jgi:hypothetical protein
MKDLKAEDFIAGTQITIDNPHDDLKPNVLTIIAVDTLIVTEDDRRNAFAVTFTGAGMIDSSGQQVMQGVFTVQGGPLDGQDVFFSVNGHAPNDVEAFEYEVVFG